MHEEKRAGNGSDRRQRPTPAISRWLFVGRRRGPRRTTDAQSNYYSDFPPVAALLTVGLLFVLSLLDGTLSLRLFALGKSEELNPVLSFALGYGDIAFGSLKIALSFLSLFVILLHWNFLFLGRVSTALAAYWLVGTYCAVVVYETGLLWW